MFRFADPSQFSSVWLWAVALGGAAWFSFQSAKLLKKTFSDPVWEHLRQGYSLPRKNLKLGLQTLVFVCILVALARPQFGDSKQEIKSVGIEMVIAVDVSQSMMAEDVRPNRLELSKRQINRLLDRMAGDKVGLIAFAGSAVLVSPMTNDYSAVRMFVDSLTTESVSTQGTVFKNVINEAMQAFERGGEESDAATRVARVLLIMTDGEDQEPGAVKLAQQLRDKGLRVFTWGIGTRKGAPIPLRDDRGYMTDYKKDKSGQVIMTKANEQALEELAKAGGGSYYHTSLDGTDIEAIRQDLAKLEKAEFDTQVQTNYDEAYQWPLGLALIFLLLELFIRERKTDKSLWRGRWISNMVPNRMSKRRKNAPTSATLALFILISPMMVWAQSPMTAYKNLEGVKALQAERPYKAYQNFTEALKDESSNEALQFNLGTSLFANKEVEKSEKQFKASAESAQSEKIQFLSWFNAGVAAGEQKKIPEALDYYQRALAINPASKEVKTNIELLLQQQSGGGESDDKDKNKNKDKKDGKGDQDKDDKKDQDKQDEKKPNEPDKNQQKPKPSPKPFKSEELTERDVKNILEELKRQEQQIRGRLNDRKSKDQDPDKDW